MRTEKKQKLAQLRHWRVRHRVKGTSERPRMSVHFSNMHIYVQFIDDSKALTLASACTTSDVLPEGTKLRANTVTAKAIGSVAALAAKDKGISTVVFDRGSLRYHGKIKALADAAREGGLKF